MLVILVTIVTGYVAWVDGWLAVEEIGREGIPALVVTAPPSAVLVNAGTEERPDVGDSAYTIPYPIAPQSSALFPGHGVVGDDCVRRATAAVPGATLPHWHSSPRQS